MLSGNTVNADVTKDDKLSSALREGAWESVYNLIVNEGANPNLEYMGNTFLYFFCQDWEENAENIEKLRNLLAVGARPNAGNLGPLHIAIEKEKLEFCKLLINADQSIVNQFQGTRVKSLPLSRAKSPEAIELLETHGADPNLIDKIEIPIFAILGQPNKESLVKKFLPRCTTDTILKMLKWLVGDNHLNMLKFIIRESDSGLNIASKNVKELLQLAIKNKNVEIIRYIKEATGFNEIIEPDHPMLPDDVRVSSEVLKEINLPLYYEKERLKQEIEELENSAWVPLEKIKQIGANYAQKADYSGPDSEQEVFRYTSDTFKHIKIMLLQDEYDGKSSSNDDNSNVTTSFLAMMPAISALAYRVTTDKKTHLLDQRSNYPWQDLVMFTQQVGRQDSYISEEELHKVTYLLYEASKKMLESGELDVLIRYV